MLIKVDEDKLISLLDTIVDAVVERDAANTHLTIAALSMYLAENIVEETVTENLS